MGESRHSDHHANPRTYLCLYHGICYMGCGVLA